MSKKDDVTKLLERLVCTHGDSAPVREVTALVAGLVDSHAGAQARIEALEKALRFYAEEDARDVEMGILGDVLDRPATAILGK